MAKIDQKKAVISQQEAIDLIHGKIDWEDIFAKKGVTRATVAAETARQLGADEPKYIKIKGKIGGKLPKNCRIISTTLEETIVEIININESTRSAAIDRFHKIMGDFAPQEVKHSGSVQIIATPQDESI